MTDPVHPAAAQGYAAASGTYVSGRPEYPEALTGWLGAALGLGPGRTVLDLGAGTGKVQPRLAETGARRIAVEPVEAMRAALASAHPGVKVLAGTAQAIPLADCSVDAVLCAQSFHWFATPDALAEIARVLRPGGRLGLVWNVRDERVGWVAALTRLLEPYEGDTPRHRTGDWARLFPSDTFGALVETVLPHAGHSGPAEQVIVERTLSVSFVAALPAAERARLAEAVRGLIAETPALQAPIVTFPYVTRAYASVRA